MKKKFSLLAIICFFVISCSDVEHTPSTEKEEATEKTTTTLFDVALEKRVDSVLALMNQEEKLGQLMQYSNPYHSTGTGNELPKNDDFDEMIRKGQIGSFLNVEGAAQTLRLQKLAVEESRMKIPLIFALDVIHGYHTAFPIPLADAASFDREAMERSARIAAIEASAVGLHWTFAPMVDVSRDPRWGRIMEGAGEDVYLNEEAARARIRGFQGDDLTAHNTIAACAKHFVGYGAALAGRDYAAADMSERMLREVYMAPFKAAVDEGVLTFMSAFNTVNGVPASGNKWLQTEILRNEWGFKGFVVSDWNSVGEMLDHGNVKDRKDAAYRGFDSGVDMDMAGRLYIEYVDDLIKEGKITQDQLDESVRRILRVKFLLGLFDDPYKYHDEERSKELKLHPDHLKAAREVAQGSIVLLQNENNVLPISKDVKTIAVVGPLANDKDSPIGNWRAMAESESAVSLLEGIKAAVSENTEVIYVEGCKLQTNDEKYFFANLEINTTDRSGFAEAVAAAKKADVVIVAIGETAFMSGEARSYTNIKLQGLQAEFLKEIKATGKPVVTTLFNGRPLDLSNVVDQTDALLNCWLLGSESGNAIADVLFGDYAPSGKLPVTFPRNVGQVPIFYEQLRTGRPIDSEFRGAFASEYRDVPLTPLFAFGHGLSYTTFEYSNLELTAESIKADETISIEATVKNTGNYDSYEVVQLYIRDLVGDGVSRPLKQLKGFEKVMVKKGESVTVKFELNKDDLSYFRLDETFGVDPGVFKVFIGRASDDIRLEGEFNYETI